MTLNRRLLAKVDAQLRADLEHAEGIQLVKVPVSDAVWSTWRRYCDLVGVPMGRALGVLLHGELASLVDEDLDDLSTRIQEREAAVASEAAELKTARKELEQRKRDLAVREAEIAEREREVKDRENNVAAVEHGLAEQLKILARTKPTFRLERKPGRNEPCWCGSEKKYKVCHLTTDG